MFKRHSILILILTLVSLLFGVGCSSRIQPPRDQKPQYVKMTVTAYCNCRQCCSWERSILRFGRPIFSSGPNKGKPKIIGQTASGKQAQMGTVAVDRRLYPFGTIFEIPGYGYGIAEDVGGAISGSHIDLWFPTHNAALQWGKRTLMIKVWKPIR